MIYALIPARGGSKRLPRKNILPLAGKPMICYTIEAALGCKSIDKVFVSTEDPEIKEVSLKCGAEVIDRPVELSGDFVSTMEVVSHSLAVFSIKPCYLIILQPTSPLRTGNHIKECITLFFKSSVYKSAVSVKRVNGGYLPNGAIYLVKTNAYIDAQKLLPDPVYEYKMDSISSIDVDTMEDFKKAKEHLE